MMKNRDSIAGIISDNEVKSLKKKFQKKFKFDMTFVIKKTGAPRVVKKHKHKNIYSCN